MTEQIVVKYWNSKMRIGLLSIKDAVMLKDNEVVRLIAEDYRGALNFRIPGTHNRISYNEIKAGIDKRDFIVQEYLPF